MADAETLSPEKQQQILRGAAAIFAQDGYEGASMSRIAFEAGVSKGTLYNYFTSKADLFAAYVQQECTHKLAQIFSGPQLGQEPTAVLRSIAANIIGMMLSPTGLTMYRVVVAEASKFPALAHVFYNAGPARAIELLASWLREQRQDGFLDVADPKFAAEQFFALCQTRLCILRRLQILQEVNDEEIQRVVDSTVGMFLNTYGRTLEAA